MNFSWPAGAACAISLTFDDDLECQRIIAAPELTARSLRATFYVRPRGSEDNPGRMQGWRDRLTLWRPVFEAGHEIGNHSIAHPSSMNVNPYPRPNSLNWSMEDVERDIQEARRRISEVFPEQEQNSFAYPCYESTVGRGRGRRSYTPLVAEHFIAGRARGEVSGELGNDPYFCDLHHLSGWPMERQSSSTMIGLVEQLVATGHWGIFIFHGIQEGHLTVAHDDFIGLLDHLVRRRAQVWTATVSEVARHIIDAQIQAL
ncbi:MAG: polysaccharide deacetylase family protein [Oscillochloris sp.]|nr:polysaccharide deacetylase family protein [Oscillochloris sp.]